MAVNSKRYRLDFGGYAAWYAEHGYGSVAFTVDDVIIVGAFSSDGEWAYDVTAVGDFVCTGEMPARFLTEIK
jgi:hypothetical protein